MSRTAGLSIVRNFAWARNEFPIANENPWGKLLYTQGPFIGETARDIEDYEKGLVTVMTAARYVKLFGDQSLMNVRWRISEDLTTWCGKKGFAFGPGLPPPELSKLLYINKMRRVPHTVAA